MFIDLGVFSLWKYKLNCKWKKGVSFSKNCSMPNVYFMLCIVCYLLLITDIQPNVKVIFLHYNGVKLAFVHDISLSIKISPSLVWNLPQLQLYNFYLEKYFPVIWVYKNSGFINWVGVFINFAWKVQGCHLMRKKLGDFKDLE